MKISPIMISPIWFNGFADKLGVKVKEAGPVIWAYKHLDELEEKSLEEVLSDNLPAVDINVIKADSADMMAGISAHNSLLDEQVTDSEARIILNAAMNGKSYDEQAKWLVNMIKGANGAMPEDSKLVERWDELKDNSEFSKDDVSELMDIALQSIDNGAGFLARQEFDVMKRSLHKLSDNVVEHQMNSGAEYAKAYAAAMYISNKCSSENENLSAYEIGLLAAKSVESNRLLALCHYGKIRAEELLPKLKIQAKKFLINACAFGLRLGIGHLAASSLIGMLSVIGITSTLAFTVVAAGVAGYIFFGYSQDSAVDEVTTLWDFVVYAKNEVVNFFKKTLKNGCEITKTIIGVKSSEEEVYVNTDIHNDTLKVKA